jgi:protein-tyrosine phosphatase
MSGRLDVAFVCTGNRFRSVLAAAAFERAADGVAVEVDSYGTLDLGAAEPLPGALREARLLGLDVSAHRARRLGSDDLADADLVVGFELKHAVAAVEVAGARVERTFVLSELVELLDNGKSEEPDPVERARARIEEAHARRRAGAPRGIREIDDPVSLPAAGQREVAHTVYEITREVAERLFERGDG